MTKNRRVCKNCPNDNEKLFKICTNPISDKHQMILKKVNQFQRCDYIKLQLTTEATILTISKQPDFNAINMKKESQQNQDKGKQFLQVKFSHISKQV